MEEQTLEKPMDEQQAVPSDAPYRQFLCVICGYIYDEEQGAEDEGIPPGTRWEDISPTWTCPDCGATKDDFEMIEI